jgi:hypothetical protein
LGAAAVAFGNHVISELPIYLVLVTSNQQLASARDVGFFEQPRRPRSQAIEDLVTATQHFPLDVPN